MSSSLPSSTRAVIVGGGIVGASVAFHLTRLGWTDVVLLEQAALAGGATWHAAGLVGRLRTSTSLTAINKYSAELYAGLEKETGHSVGWKQVGSLIAATTPARLTQLQRTCAMAEYFGVESHLVDAQETRERWPLLRVDDVLGSAWLPHDGKVIPKEVTIALAKGASMRGARVVENARVVDILHEDGRATGVRVALNHPDGSVEERTLQAEIVVLTGGMWARQIGLRCGVSLPLHPVEHHYLVSHPIEGAFDELPVGRDPDRCLYFRGEGNRVMLGAFQAESKPWKVDRVPDRFSFQLLEPDWEKFSVPLAHGKHRIPALQTSGFEKFVNGPESFTPDNNFLMGETPELRSLFVACGFNSVGIASAGGAGKYLAEWILQGQPSLDLWSVDVRRFGPWANNRSYLRARVVEVLGLHYQMAWPNREPETAREVRTSPLHSRLAALGASFGVKGGWERPNWFTRPDGALTPVMDYSFGRQNWFPNHAAEHRAARETVALFDQSGFGKLTVRGADAETLLQRLCANDVAVAPGRVVYTAMLNERGGFESDLTVVRVARDEFYLVTGTTQPRRDLDWIRRHRRPTDRVEVLDVTSGWGVLGIMGPRSRDLLARVTDADLSTQAFPFGTAQTVAVGMATARAVRITYVGELGWELHVPVDQMATAFDALCAVGVDLGCTQAGHYAINSLRLEKGFRAFGADLSPDETPIEAGLGFAVAWNKPGGFIGREALLRQRDQGVSKRLALFALEDSEPVLWGSELILRNGVTVGYTTSGSYGHTVGAGVALGYVKGPVPVTPDHVLAGAYHIRLNGRDLAARVSLKPWYDPDRDGSCREVLEPSPEDPRTGLSRSQLRHSRDSLAFMIPVWNCRYIVVLGLLCLMNTKAETLRVFVGTYTGGSSEGIYAFRFDNRSGEVTGKVLAAKAENPSFLVASPNGRFLYSVNETDRWKEQSGGYLTAFEIRGADGSLRELNQQSAGGGAPCHLTIDASGRCVLAANYTGGSTVVLPVDTDGSLKPRSALIQHRGSSVNASRQKEPHAHSVNLSPDGRHAYVADLGTDRVYIHRFDPVAGTLTPAVPDSVSLPPGSGPRHFAIGPDGRRAFVINEILSTLTGFSIERKTGALTILDTVTTLPGGPVVGNSTAQVCVHPNGRFVYGSNRGDDSIVVYAIGTDGRLSFVERVPSGGKTPRNFNLDPSGRFLWAANQSSDSISIFKVDGRSGRLTPHGKPITVGNPVCVIFIP